MSYAVFASTSMYVIFFLPFNTPSWWHHGSMISHQIIHAVFHALFLFIACIVRRYTVSVINSNCFYHVCLLQTSPLGNASTLIAWERTLFLAFVGQCFTATSPSQTCPWWRSIGFWCVLFSLSSTYVHSSRALCYSDFLGILCPCWCCIWVTL